MAESLFIDLYELTTNQPFFGAALFLGRGFGTVFFPKAILSPQGSRVPLANISNQLLGLRVLDVFQDQTTTRTSSRIFSTKLEELTKDSSVPKNPGMSQERDDPYIPILRMGLEPSFLV